jgi:hypothetical protein
MGQLQPFHILTHRSWGLGDRLLFSQDCGIGVLAQPPRASSQNFHTFHTDWTFGSVLGLAATSAVPNTDLERWPSSHVYIVHCIDSGPSNLDTPVVRRAWLQIWQVRSGDRSAACL